MERSIIKISPTTYAISLPNFYVKHYNLQKGQKLKAMVVREKLIIEPEIKSVFRILPEQWNDLRDNEKIKVLRFLNYLGYNRIIVPSVNDFIKERLNALIEQTSTGYRIEFFQRSELKELISILTFTMILFGEIKNWRYNKELILNILKRLKRLNYLNILKDIEYDFEKNHIVNKIIESISDSLTFLNIYYDVIADKSMINSINKAIINEVFDIVISLLKYYRNYIQQKLPIHKLMLIVIKSINKGFSLIASMKKEKNERITHLLTSVLISFDILR